MLLQIYYELKFITLFKLYLLRSRLLDLFPPLQKHRFINERLPYISTTLDQVQ